LLIWVTHMKTTIEIEDRLLQRAKRYAAQQGTTLRAIIEDALRARLTPRPEATRSHRFSPPIVKGTSQPAIDIADRDALYDHLDAPS